MQSQQDAPRGAGEPLIELRGVARDYVSAAGTVRAMRDVDLVIQAGEFVAIVGTSGSGKSTMMNILGCLDRPTRGTYTLDGIDVGSRTNDGRALVRNRLIGFIFQGFNLLSRTTALENVELPLQYRGFAAKVRHERARRALAQVGLANREHHTPNQLSGGQQQRVAIARALVTDPPLLLADEPTGNLDTRTSLEVLSLLQNLNRESGITIVLVTHEHDIAACANRVITMRDGRIVSDETQAKPSDAAAELAALPPPQEFGAGPDEAEAISPADALRARIGGPVPFSVYAMTFLGSFLGLLAGVVYNLAVLGTFYWSIALALTVVGGAFLGARFGKRRLGQPLTNDQRVRLSLWYTIFVSAITGIVALCIPDLLGRPFLDRIDGLSPAGMAGLIGVALMSVGAVALLNYLLLTLFSPSAANGNGRPAGSHA